MKNEIWDFYFDCWPGSVGRRKVSVAAGIGIRPAAVAECGRRNPERWASSAGRRSAKVDRCVSICRRLSGPSAAGSVAHQPGRAVKNE